MNNPNTSPESHNQPNQLKGTYMPMTDQEFFDKTITHLLKQGKQSIVPSASNTCMYRGPDNTSCAIGCHIPDEMYSSGMENLRVSALFKTFPKLRKIFQGLSNHLLHDMQFFHDRGMRFCDNGFDFCSLNELRVIADRHSLNLPEGI